jgi:hypothetical protein
MQRAIGFAILVAVLLGAGFTARPIAQRSNSSDKEASAENQWEYLVVAGGTVNLSSSGIDSRMRKQPDDSFQREAYALERNFDKLGAKGWMLVAVHGAPQDPVFYFRRPKESR